LALVPIGSTVAFFALVSLPTLALNISYFIPILFFMIRKLRGHAQYGPFKLGRWGIIINLFSLLYILYIVSIVVLPPSLPVTGSNMNYSAPLVMAAVLLALTDWFVSGRNRFKVPVPRNLRLD